MGKNSGKKPATSLDQDEGRIRVTFERLNVNPDIADKSIKIMKVVNDSGVSLADALKAAEIFRLTGTGGNGAVLFPAAILSEVGVMSEYGDAKYFALGANEIAISLNMAKVVNMTPGKLSATLVLMVGQKALAVAGVATNDQKAQCIEAISKLGVDVAVTALTWETGIGAVLGVTGAVLDAGAAYQACRLVK